MNNSYDGGDSNDFGNHPLSIYLREFDLTPTTGLTQPPPAWETSKEINKTLFTGYPTYVDYKCVVYLHEAEDKQLLETMSSIISKNYNNLPEPDADYEYTIGQPVIARYPIDKRCYRAIMRSNQLNYECEHSVFFVDYGNVDGVKPEDIRPYAPFPNLPSIANKYCISGIQPKGGAKAYVQDDLDQMHLEIVTKLVSVRLSPSELTNTIKMCSMRLGTKDLASTFIEKNLAEKATIQSTSSAPTFISTPATAVPINPIKCRNPLPSNLNTNGSETDYDVSRQYTYIHRLVIVLYLNL